MMTEGSLWFALAIVQASCVGCLCKQSVAILMKDTGHEIALTASLVWRAEPREMPVPKLSWFKAASYVAKKACQGYTHVTSGQYQVCQGQG